MNISLTAACCLIIASLLFGGCDSLVSNVSVLHELAPGATYSFAFVPFRDQDGSPEFEKCASLVRAQLTDIGYREVRVDAAQVLVFFNYWIGVNLRIRHSYPILARTGTSALATTETETASDNTNMIPADVTPTPVYSMAGPQMTTETPFERVLVMEIVDRQASIANGKVLKLYEGTVRSAGAGGSLYVVMPAMVAALFSDFPGKSGSTFSVTATLP